MSEIRTLADFALPLGWRVWHLLAGLPAAGAAEATLWDSGGLYPWASLVGGPHPMEILAGAADTNKRIRVTGIRAGALVTETKTTNGANGSTPEALVAPFDRVLLVEALDACAGAVSVRIVAGAVVVATIAAGLGTSRMGVFSVPANHRGYVIRTESWLSASADVETRVYGRLAATDAFALRHHGPCGTGPRDLIDMGLGPMSGLDFPAGSDIDMRAIELTGVVTPRVGAAFKVITVPNG